MEQNKKFSITSPGLKNNDPCPREYVMPQKGGKNISPYLKWENAPEGTKSFVLTCIDPHPVANYWVHWMVINIPANICELPLDASNKKMPSGCIELNNSYGFKGYGGPQPPDGTGAHPYIFSIYALNTEKIQNNETFLREVQLKKVIEKFKLGQAELTLFFGK